MWRNRLLLLAVVLLASLPAMAQNNCNPPQSPLGSMGCQPAIPQPFQGGDLIQVWRPTSFPNSLGTGTLTNLSSYINQQFGLVPTTFTSLQTFTASPTGIAVTHNETIGGALVMTGNQSAIGANQSILTETFDQTLSNSTTNQTVTQAYLTHSINGQQLWNNFDVMYYNVPGGDSVAFPGGDIVTRYVSAIHQTNAPNVSQETFIAAMNDFTLQPSSVSGSLLTEELDMAVAGADDSPHYGRQVLLVSGARAPGYAGTDTVITQGINLISDANTTFKNGFAINAAFNHAGIDFTAARPVSNAPAIQLATGQIIGLDNAGSGGIPVVSIKSDGAGVISSTGFGTTGAGQISFASGAGGIGYDSGTNSIVTYFGGTKYFFVNSANITATPLFTASAGMISGASILTTAAGDIALSKSAASNTAPGAGGMRLRAVCGTSGTLTLEAFAGTSSTPVAIVSNVGTGVTGC